jgi:hypothetical protein
VWEAPVRPREFDPPTGPRRLLTGARLPPGGHRDREAQERVHELQTFLSVVPSDLDQGVRVSGVVAVGGAQRAPTLSTLS